MGLSWAPVFWVLGLLAGLTLGAAILGCSQPVPEQSQDTVPVAIQPSDTGGIPPSSGVLMEDREEGITCITMGSVTICD